jgi:hypothetical protein
MLKWENYLILQEKMKKLREDISEAFNSNTDKMAEIDNKQNQLKEILSYYQRLCQIID